VEFSKTGREWSSDSIYNGVKSGLDNPGAASSHVNELVFLNSSLGSHYYIPQYGITTIFQTERDIFFPEGKFAAVGRYLLFRVNSPTRSVRLVLDITSSILGDGSQSLPPATVVGESAVAVGLVGHGAARVVSPPFFPKVVDGVAYVLLDLGAEPKFLSVPRSGLMGLFGNKVPLDYRRLVAFARQIRLVDADAPDMSAIPSRLDKFPSDLGNKSLQFSGIYEDGWLGDNGFVVLSADHPGKVVFHGLFPKELGLDRVDLTLSVEGGASIRKSLDPGSFELQVPAPAGKSRIGFHFSAIGRLPPGDGRPAVALLSSISLGQDDVKSLDQFAKVNLPKVIQGVAVQADGVFLDGWLAPKGFVVVNPDQTGKVILQGMVPGGIGLENQEVTIAGGAGGVVRKILEPGPFEIEVPVKIGRSRLSIDFVRAAELPNGDGRSVAALLQSMIVRSREE
jgi:hypothetical protein